MAVDRPQLLNPWRPLLHVSAHLERKKSYVFSPKGHLVYIYTCSILYTHFSIPVFRFPFRIWCFTVNISQASTLTGKIGHRFAKNDAEHFHTAAWYQTFDSLACFSLGNRYINPPPPFFFFFFFFFPLFSLFLFIPPLENITLHLTSHTQCLHHHHSHLSLRQSSLVR